MNVCRTSLKEKVNTSIFNDDILNAMKLWLNSEIGSDSWHLAIHPSHNPTGTDTFYFKHEEDKVKFILRWL